MEFMTGKKEKEVLDLVAVFADGMEGREVKVNGAIMSVRNMGDIAFVILRKRDGVLQTVYEKGVTDADFAELKEETFVEVSGVLRKEERAPRGMELRLKSVRILSKPEEPMPIAVSKWKMSASLEAKLDMRSLTLRNLRERARFRIQEGIARWLLTRCTTSLPQRSHTPLTTSSLANTHLQPVHQLTFISFL